MRLVHLGVRLGESEENWNLRAIGFLPIVLRLPMNRRTRRVGRGEKLRLWSRTQRGSFKNPEGSKPLAGGRAERHHRIHGENETSIPEGWQPRGESGPGTRLRSLRDRIRRPSAVRGCRSYLARPPANGCHPYGILNRSNQHCDAFHASQRWIAPFSSGFLPIALRPPNERVPSGFSASSHRVVQPCLPKPGDAIRMNRRSSRLHFRMPPCE